MGAREHPRYSPHALLITITEWSGTSPFQCCADTRSSFGGAFSVLPNAELLVRALSGYVALRTSAACPKHSVFQLSEY